MKIKDVVPNNRKRLFEVQLGREILPFPYAKLRAKPTARNKVEDVFADPELGKEAFTYRLEDGTEDTIHVDTVLEYNEDPEHMRELMLHNLTVEAKRQLEKAELPRREVIRRLGTSASQFYRLLDETNHTKSFGQLFDLFHVLGCDVEVKVVGRRKGRTRRGATADR